MTIWNVTLVIRRKAEKNLVYLRGKGNWNNIARAAAEGQRLLRTELEEFNDSRPVSIVLSPKKEPGDETQG